jgi:hypothetical protein
MGVLDDAIREHLELKRRHGADASEVARQEQEALGPARRGPEPLEVATATAEHEDAEPEPVMESHAPPLEPQPAPPADEDAWEDDQPPLAPQPPAERYVELDPEPPLRGEGEPHAAPPVPEPEPHEPEPEPHHHPEQYRDEPQPEPHHEPEPELYRDEPEAEPEDRPEPSQRAAGLFRDPDAPAQGAPPSADQPTVAFDADDVRDAQRRADAQRQAHEPADEEASEASDDDVLEDTPDFLQETPEHDRLWFEQRPPRDFDFDG